MLIVVLFEEVPHLKNPVSVKCKCKLTGNSRLAVRMSGHNKGGRKGP